MLKRMLVIVCLVMLWTSIGFAETIKVAIVPLSDSAFAEGSSNGLYVGYNYKETLNNSFNNKFEFLRLNTNYCLVPQSEINNILTKLNYDITNIKFISKDEIMTIQKETDASIVIALDMYSFTSVITFENHFYSTLRCRAYNKNIDKYTEFSINNEANKSGSIFHSQNSRSKKNSLIFMNETFDKLISKLKSEQII